MSESPTETPITDAVEGLDCDNPACAYSDPSVKLASFGDYIDRPCPTCGEPLLDQVTYDELMRLVKIVEAMNELSLSEPNDNSPESKDKKAQREEEEIWHNDYSM